MADGEEKPTQAVKAIQLGDQPVIDDNSMDDLLEKLKMLNYESEFLKAGGNNFKPLSRVYFTAATDNANVQFFYFTSLCAWMLQVAGRKDFEAPGQFDDPNASSTNLLNELRAMSLNVSGIPPNRIRPGHGEGVLTILHLLADRALLSRGFAFRTIEYPAPRTDIEERVGEEGAGDAVEDPDAIDDNIAVDSDTDDDEFKGSTDKRGKDGRGAGTDLIQPQVPAEVWALEVERVAPLLQYRSDDVRDWRARVENATTLLKAVDKMYPDVKQMLERMGDDLAKSLDRIQKREQTLAQQFQDQVEEYRNKLRELNTVQDTFNAASKNVAQLSNELNSITETLDQTKADIQDREERSSDISPLMKIKEAVSKVKSEIKEMSLRIGVLQHTVLHYTLRQQKARRASPNSTNAMGVDDSGLMEPDFSGYV
jgi:estrogen-related receptor beta like 1